VPVALVARLHLRANMSGMGRLSDGRDQDYRANDHAQAGRPGPGGRQKPQSAAGVLAQRG
jgi:hypothetical protein